MNLAGDRSDALPLDFGSTNGAVGGIRTVLRFMTLSPGVGGDDTNALVNGPDSRRNVQRGQPHSPTQSGLQQPAGFARLQ